VTRSKISRSFRRGGLLVLGCVLAAGVVPAIAATAAGGQRIDAKVVNDDPREGRKIEHLAIDLDRFSTADDLAVLASGHGRAVAIGRAKLDRTLGQKVVAAVVTAEGADQKIVLVLDGPVRWFDARTRPSAKKFPHGILEIRLDAEGKGSGELLTGAQVKFGPDGVQIEQAAGEPMRLIQVSAKG
jgi:hypothetical protein